MMRCWPSLHHSITPSLHHSITPSLHRSSLGTAFFLAINRRGSTTSIIGPPEFPGSLCLLYRSAMYRYTTSTAPEWRPENRQYLARPVFGRDYHDSGADR